MGEVTIVGRRSGREDERIKAPSHVGLVCPQCYHALPPMNEFGEAKCTKCGRVNRANQMPLPTVVDPRPPKEIIREELLGLAADVARRVENILRLL